MKINIRKATKQDAKAAYRLIKELAKFENAVEEVTLSLEQFIKDGFECEQPLFRLNVAELTKENGEKEIVGITLFYIIYSTWKGKIVYLDDLVVTQKYRRNGVGQLLLNALILFAKTENANQLRWHVLDWNTPAIKLYEKLGMKLENEWITCKLSQQQLASYVSTI
ncbi:MAG: GNAT family N-acetyltransferase [Chitinophagales bacterium]